MTSTTNRLTLTDKDDDALDIENIVDPANGAAFLRTSMSGVYLSAQQVRQLINRLEPHAAPARAALDVFNDYPLGQVFTRSDGNLRVKVSSTHYSTIRSSAGTPPTYLASVFLTDQPEDIIEAVSA
ncbi:hypothetical protein J2Y69_003327 [Microbacterium resistens]|uniref:Uncharacterized protein n=1 Tax=Microbacterium resistens TaxID=156977 RepID=A0ABU1SI59_9MICO|nr:hypothetical protein [Microbacterium resistens]MDR6868703.1 hypothetical protein [Microbacterium resistens]